MFEIIDSGRHKSALSGDLTPLSIDIENKCGKFVGSEGYIYDTSLEHCTCADFAIHGETMACKHSIIGKFAWLWNWANFPMME